MAKAKVLLRVLVVTLDAPALMDDVDQLVDRVSSGREDRKYLLGSASLAGHWIKSHCSDADVSCPYCRQGGAPARPKKRPFSVLLVPSRRLMFWNARLGSDCANALTLMGCSAAVRMGIEIVANHAK